MQTENKKIWFPAKKYGWGWGSPCAWQGWVVIAAFVVATSVSGIFMLPKHMGAFYGCEAVAIVVLMAFCYARGEKPRWRWGKD